MNQVSKPVSVDYFPAIDLLRGFAAISVVVYHFIEHYQWKAFPVEGWLTWFRIGWMGVDLFFVISGFVIALAVFSNIDKYGPQRFRLRFMRKRFVRIAPLHYLTLVVFVLFITPELLYQNFFVNFAAHLAFVHNLNFGLHGAINGANWSIATEMQFYILVTLTAPWLMSVKPWKLAIAFFGIAWAWRYGVTMLIPFDSANGTFRIFIAATQLPGMLDEFAVGILLARLVRSELPRKFGKYLTNNLVFVASAAIAAIALSSMLTCFWHYATFWEYPMMVVLFRSAIGISFACVVFAAISVQLPGMAWKILLPVTWLGTISYGIYLWHLPVLLSLQRVSGLTAERALPMGLVITVLLAAASWYLFEKPVLRRFGSLSSDDGASSVTKTPGGSVSTGVTNSM